MRYGTRAEIDAALTARALRIAVEDDGPGIPAERRDEALRPFVRLDAARNQDRGQGTGLGLAIAADIAILSSDEFEGRGPGGEGERRTIGHIADAFRDAGSAPANGDSYFQPFGLARFGVAPDHQSIKAVAKRYETVNLGASVRFAGNVEVGRDVSVAELLSLYDAVVLATGAPQDRPLDVPGADLPGASMKVEGTLAHPTAVASERGTMILAPDRFFDGWIFDPPVD